MIMYRSLQSQMPKRSIKWQNQQIQKLNINSMPYDHKWKPSSYSPIKSMLSITTDSNLVRNIINVLIISCVDQCNGIFVQERIRTSHNGWPKIVCTHIKMISPQCAIPEWIANMMGQDEYSWGGSRQRVTHLVLISFKILLTISSVNFWAESRSLIVLRYAKHRNGRKKNMASLGSWIH